MLKTPPKISAIGISLSLLALASGALLSPSPAHPDEGARAIATPTAAPPLADQCHWHG